MLQQAYKKFIHLLLLFFSIMILQACDLVEDEEEIADPTVSKTESYHVKYVSDMSMIREGKSTFTIEITDINSGAPLPGLNVSLMPMMDMVAGHMHDAPVGDVVDNGDGSYEMTVYYLMASKMMDGTVMGEWTLNIMIGGMGGETATFVPDVMMAMGDSVKANLMGQNDMIEGMMAAEKRRYFVFKNHLMGSTGDHSFSFFIAARESMMSHVAVYEDATLNQGDVNYEYLVSPIVVEVSTDATNWSVVSNSIDGNYLIVGLTGLTDGVEGHIYVRLTIQGEQKTTNGLAPAGDGSNDYATFTVTPGMTMTM